MTTGQKREGKAVNRNGASDAGGFTEEERAAMRERTREFREYARTGAKGAKPGGEEAVLAKIATFPAPDRAKAEKVHAIVRANAPGLVPRLWYGMPAYSNAEGDVVCWFQDAQKFKTRYATLGFSDEAKLDDGSMWPVTFALHELSSAEEARIAQLVKRALG